MDLVSKLIALTHWRFVVRPNSVPRMVDFLRIDLKERGFAQQSKIPDEVLVVLIQEAYRRAAERENDKLARYGQLYKEIEIIAREIEAAFEGQSDADPRIRSILEFHHQI